MRTSTEVTSTAPATTKVTFVFPTKELNKFVEKSLPYQKKPNHPNVNDAVSSFVAGGHQATREPAAISPGESGLFSNLNPEHDENEKLLRNKTNHLKESRKLSEEQSSMTMAALEGDLWWVYSETLARNWAARRHPGSPLIRD